MDRALHKTVAHQDLQNIFNYNQIAPMPQPQEGSEKEPSFFYSLELAIVSLLNMLANCERRRLRDPFGHQRKLNERIGESWNMLEASLPANIAWRERLHKRDLAKSNPSQKDIDESALAARKLDELHKALLAAKPFVHFDPPKRRGQHNSPSLRYPDEVGMLVSLIRVRFSERNKLITAQKSYQITADLLKLLRINVSVDAIRKASKKYDRERHLGKSE